MLARFREAGFIKHAGDKGENREHILREFWRIIYQKSMELQRGK